MNYRGNYNNKTKTGNQQLFITRYIYNTCALSKHIGKYVYSARNVPNTHIYLYASTVHMYCIYPAILNRK